MTIIPRWSSFYDTALISGEWLARVWYIALMPRQMKAEENQTPKAMVSRQLKLG